ncbi:ATP-binding protein [Actinomadura terrae]|uniref:ATP-binding protein n=1 Tax=Actinomadura terrae TaxID=604353 RepID=UPI001FA76983|nr:ATP-binding protein [Actinomadura terrae]
MSPVMLLARESVPLCWRRTFPGGPEQARAVRRFVGCLLAGCPHLDDVLLAADELAVNAIRHTRSGLDGGTFAVEVAWCGDTIVMAVADQGGPDEPALVDADESAETGRGLRTVSLTARSWGWHGNRDGRTVTAVFAAEGAA